jgi:hypothetical protein
MGLAFIRRSIGRNLGRAVENWKIKLDSKGHAPVENYLRNLSNPGQLWGFCCIYISITRGNC